MQSAGVSSVKARRSPANNGEGSVYKPLQVRCVSSGTLRKDDAYESGGGTSIDQDVEEMGAAVNSPPALHHSAVRQAAGGDVDFHNNVEVEVRADINVVT